MDNMHDLKSKYREDIPSFAGYRVIEFAKISKKALQEVAELLTPYEQEIVERWIKTQYSAWSPPGITRDELRQIFGGMFHDMLACMRARKPESCVDNLGSVGTELAVRNFPYEALIMSLHFLEESYMPFLLETKLDRTIEWLVGLDEFIHAALASIATAYFQYFRRELLEEAEVSRLVQEGLLPDIPKRLINLEASYIYIPSGERAKIGGDLIDLFELSQEEAAFIVGDLSGHGLEAATDAAMIRYLFRGFMREGYGPAVAMEKLNRVLSTELPTGQFATALAGVYHSSGILKLVSAGHPMPVVCDKECYLLEPSGTMLAVSTDSVYSAQELQLEPGDNFVAYTDGLTEARGEGEFFGEDRVLEVAAGMRNASARAIAEELRDEVLRFTGGRLIDDVAILVLKCGP